ncbi:MAG: glycosyltransferase family 4 protein [Bacteroidales bacterium]
MRIIHIIPGSGGSFYCGNCLRDSKYVMALRKMGHEVIKIPMYLPLFANEHDLGEVPVFYGAISIYLKQLYPVFEKAPKWFDTLLNSKPMLKLAAGMAGSTRAKGLSEMTISMLKGEHGHQHEELDRMIDWIKIHYPADVVHLSNALLSGLAPRIKQKLGVKVFCSLQDEDVWIDVMKPEFRQEAWNLMHENARSIDRFISVSHYFSALMKDRIDLTDEMVRTIYLGIDPSDYEYIPVSDKPRNIGFISRMCEENGLDILVEAFISLKDREGYEDVKLILTGGSTGDDKHYISKLKKRINECGLEGRVEFQEDFEEEGRKEFFRKVSVVSVPVRIGEAFGLYLLESMASGVPVVQPALGAFPEIIKKSGGGLVYEPNQPVVLSDSLARILSEPHLLGSLSQSGYEGVHKYFDIFNHARELVNAYESVK